MQPLKPRRAAEYTPDLLERARRTLLHLATVLVKGSPLDIVASCGHNSFVIAVGIRELKNNLSKYIMIVRRGEEVLVTDRGVVVASLRPPGPAAADPAVPAALLELVRQGRVRLGGPTDPSVYRVFESVAPRGLAARLLEEERGDR